LSGITLGELLELPTPADMIDGYLDGFEDDRDDYPSQSNRSEAYRHGWLNGRDDRLGKPRASAQMLRDEAARIIKATLS
jgi:hypothetical protein